RPESIGGEVLEEGPAAQSPLERPDQSEAVGDRGGSPGFRALSSCRPCHGGAVGLSPATRMMTTMTTEPTKTTTVPALEDADALLLLILALCRLNHPELLLAVLLTDAAEARHDDE